MTDITPFTFTNNILSSREDIFDESTSDQYVPFLINRALSYFPDTILYANDMNQYHMLSKSAQYHYYLNSIPKRKRFSKWAKKTSDETVVAISKMYQCNETRAQEIASLLPLEAKEKIINEMELSDGKRSKQPRRGKSKAT